MEQWRKLRINIDGDTRISRVLARVVVGRRLENVGQQLVALFLLVHVESGCEEVLGEESTFRIRRHLGVGFPGVLPRIAAFGALAQIAPQQNTFVHQVGQVRNPRQFTSKQNQATC